MVDVRLGVLQGSILGPILFLLFVNDINKCDNPVNFTKFAGDTTVLVSAKTLGEAAKTMKKALTNVNLSFQRNKLNLNPSKRENGICQNWNLSESVFCPFLKKLEFVRIGLSQNWNLSESELVRIGIGQNRNWSELEYVRIGIC